jgi:hypothetical protein
MEMEPKERATFALNRARRMLEAGELDAAIYHIEQSILDAEKEARKAAVEKCATIAKQMLDERSFGPDAVIGRVVADGIRASFDGRMR